LEQFDPLIEPPPTVIGSRDFVVVNMVKGKLHHVAGNAVIARKRGK